MEKGYKIFFENLDPFCYRVVNNAFFRMISCVDKLNFEVDLMNVSKDWAEEHAAVGLREILLSFFVGDFAAVIHSMGFKGWQ